MPSRKTRYHKLSELIATLKLVPEELVKEAVPQINEALRKMGKPGGPLQRGNEVKCHVVAEGNRIKVVAVFPDEGIRRPYMRIIERTVGEILKRQLEKW